MLIQTSIEGHFMNRKHIFFYKLLLPLVILFLKIRFGYKYEVPKSLPKNYVVLSNHATDYDMLFVGASFKRQMYFVGSEHIARWGFLFKLINFAFAPIIRYKGTVAASTVKEIFSKTRNGANVCMFAEGVRTWDGVSSPILPSTAKMIKKLGCGLVTYKITGGYFTSPMWGGASIRRGEIKGAPVNIYSEEQLKAMSVDEIYTAIVNDLHEDAYARQLEAPKRYKSKRGAEHMEHLLFVCPDCGAYDSITSSGNTFGCPKCGMSVKYDEFGMLDHPRFKTVKELSDWQRAKVNEDISSNMVYYAENAILKTVDNDHNEHFVTSGRVEISHDKLVCGDASFDINDISVMAMHGQKAIVFTANGEYYELIPDESYNSWKFHLYYNSVKNSQTEKAR